MFSKKEGFKYESEVSALIKVLTDNLNQRIIALELQNNQLIINNQRLEGELVQLKNGLYNDVYRLEKRITDFTDIWHPIMTENINRIKTDLEKTIIETERKDIKNIQEELESKLINIVDTKINYKIDENNNNKFLQDNFNSYTNTYSIKLSDLAKRLNDKCNYFKYYNGELRFNLMDIYTKQINILDDDDNIIINCKNSDGKLITVDNLQHGSIPLKETITKQTLNKQEYIFCILIKEKGFIKLFDYLQKNCPYIKFEPKQIRMINWSSTNGTHYEIPIDKYIENIEKYKNYILYGSQLPTW